MADNPTLAAALAGALHAEWDRRQGEPSEPGYRCPDCAGSADRILADPEFRAALERELAEAIFEFEAFDTSGRHVDVKRLECADMSRFLVARLLDPKEAQYTPGGLRYPTLDELNGGPVRSDLPMLAPTTPAPEA